MTLANPPYIPPKPPVIAEASRGDRPTGRPVSGRDGGHRGLCPAAILVAEDAPEILGFSGSEVPVWLGIPDRRVNSVTVSLSQLQVQSRTYTILDRQIINLSAPALNWNDGQLFDLYLSAGQSEGLYSIWLQVNRQNSEACEVEVFARKTEEIGELDSIAAQLSVTDESEDSPSSRVVISRFEYRQ